VTELLVSRQAEERMGQSPFSGNVNMEAEDNFGIRDQVRLVKLQETEKISCML
jgi:hypothetical protein